MRMRLIIIFIAFLLIMGCKQESYNPYSDVQEPETEETTTQFPVGSFPYLYQQVFKPTCANSGCHDGSFEPDFRTLNSAYNTLVNHPVIANDLSNSFSYRVVPYDTSSSLLHERLMRFLPNSSGVMPLAVENNSDWPQKKSEYIAAIKSWIMAGAPDVSGNPAPPANTNLLPMNYGMMVFPPGNTTTQFQRGTPGFSGIGPYVIFGGVADVYIYPYDDNAGLFNYQTLAWDLSTSATDFQSLANGVFEPTLAVYGVDFGGAMATFTKRSLIDFSPFSGQTVYMRLRLNDGVQGADSFIPNSGSAPFWHAIYSFQIP
jgi:hypothetical protein